MVRQVNPNRSTGIYDGQSVYQLSNSTSSTGGLLDARRNFVDIINNLLIQSPYVSDNTAGITNLNRSQTITQNASWFRIDNSYGIELPLPYQYNYHVYNSVERDTLLYRQDIQQMILNNKNIKVLVDATNTTNPSWSIWTLDLTLINYYIVNKPNMTLIEILITYSDTIFIIANNYDLSVQTYYNTLDTNLITSSSLIDKNLIYVESDETAANFWTIYQYNDFTKLPPNYTTNNYLSYAAMTANQSSFSNGEYLYVSYDETLVPSMYVNSNIAFWSIYQFNNGVFTLITAKFILMQAQAYRLAITNDATTTDFLNYTDWYAQNINISGQTLSFSATNYPMVTYANERIRNNTEGATPTNVFVIINDNINPWYWTMWDSVSAAWVTVASENGTIQLSSNFYDPSRIQYNPFNPSASAIPIRDGSYELRVLADMFYYGTLFQTSDLNNIFFDILYFIHAQQPNVDWAFKTHFMTIAGYQIPLIQTAIETTDMTESLTEYINSVKPYRVKIRNFESQYTPVMEQANVHVTDFDKPAYYDTVLKSYRRLDPNNPSDMNIIANNRPWSDWYEQLEIPSITATFVGDGVTSNFNVGANGTVLSVTLNGAAVTNYTPINDETLNITTFIFNNPPAVNDIVIIVVSLYNTYAGAIIGLPPSMTCSFISDGTTSSYAIGTSGAIEYVIVDEQITTTYTSTIVNNITTVTLDKLLSKGQVVEIVIQNNQSVYYTPPNNRIRKLDISLLFDRVSGDADNYGNSYGGIYSQTDSYVGTAYERIFDYYTPQPGMPPNDPASLMNLNSSGNVISGGLMQPIVANTSETDYDNYTNTIDGGTLPGPTTVSTTVNPDYSYYELRDPRYEANHPEERIPLTINDMVNFNIKSLALNGACPQTTKCFDVSNYTSPTATLFHGGIAATPDSIYVYADGVRLSSADYAIDYFGRTVTPNLVINSNRISTILIKIFELGYSSNLLETDYYAGNSLNQYQIYTEAQAANVLATTDGNFVTPSLSNNTINLTTTTTPNDVAIYVFDEAPVINTPLQEILTYNSAQQWVLQYPDSSSIPQHVGTIVEVNGLRLLPPLTYYGGFTVSKRYLPFDISLNANTVINVYVDNVLYNYAIPTATKGNSTLPFGVIVSGTMPNNTDGMFAIYNNWLISLDPTFMSSNVCLVIHQENDFEIQNSTLTITKTLSSTDNIVVTTFENASLMSIQTYTYLINDSKSYIMNSAYGTNYTWITVNGKVISPDKDYSFLSKDMLVGSDWDNAPQGFDTVGFDILLDTELGNTIVNLTLPKLTNNAPNPIIGTWMVATVFNGTPARKQISWNSTTATPNNSRMVPVIDDGGFGVQPYDMTGFDISGQWQLTIPRYGVTYDSYNNPVGVPLYKSVGWDNFRSDSVFSGTLVNDLLPTDQSIQIQISDLQFSPKLLPENPFYQPILPPPTVTINLTGDGSTKTFTINETGILLITVNGTNLVLGEDYTLTQTGSSSVLVFNNAPELNAAILINVTTISAVTPGVIYINGERIEYWSLTQSGSIVTISNIRRGTNCTSDCCEQRFVETVNVSGIGPFYFNYNPTTIDIYKQDISSFNYTSDGVTSTYVISNVITDSIANISIISNTVLILNIDYTISYPTISQLEITFLNVPNNNVEFTVNLTYNIWLNQETDFIVGTNDSATTITFVNSLNNVVVFGFTVGNYISKGTMVLNGMQKYHGIINDNQLIDVSNTTTKFLMDD